MVFWMGILTGCAFAWMAIKIGFYEIWTILFNICVAVYLGIFLSPVVAELLPSAAAGSYGMITTVAAVTLIGFAILHGISFLLFLGNFRVKLPIIIDKAVAAAAGFFAGLLVWAFVTMIVTISPLAQNNFTKTIGLDSENAKFTYLCWWSNKINLLVANDSSYTTSDAIDDLRKTIQQQAKKIPEPTTEPTPSDPNSPPPPTLESPPTPDPNEL